MRFKPVGRRQWIMLGLRLLVVLSLIPLGGVYVTTMPGHSYSGPFQPLSADETAIRDNLKESVETIAGKIGPRNLAHPESLQAAADYISSAFRKHDYVVTDQKYPVAGKWVSNLEAELKGQSNPTQEIIVGAHYDSIGDSPGANDNGSGVAVLLELARLLKDKAPARTIKFVGFANEEPPYFQTDRMGSRFYAHSLKNRGDHVTAMLSIETVGYYSDAEHSQRYPLPFGLLYPTKGDFIGFVGNIASRTLVRNSVTTFRNTCQFPSEGACAPGWMTGIGWSDQWSFWKEDYDAEMITDTALFRYPYYHKLQDTPDKLDYDRMARMVTGLEQVVLATANRPAK